MSVLFTIELEVETDGRWVAEVLELPGTLAYGATQEEAIARVQALALRVVADRREHAEGRGRPGTRRGASHKDGQGSVLGGDQGSAGRRNEEHCGG